MLLMMLLRGLLFFSVVSEGELEIKDGEYIAVDGLKLCCIFETCVESRSAVALVVASGAEDRTGIEDGNRDIECWLSVVEGDIDV